MRTSLATPKNPHPRAVSPGRTWTVDRRFRGPAASANGGYVAGLFAEEIGGCEVTLVAPPPLDVPLHMTRGGDRVVLETSCGAAVAYATAGEPTAPPPAPVSFERASAASAHFVGHARHPLPECFVCGTRREAADALTIFSGREGGADVGPLYAPWIPGRGLALPFCDLVATRYLVAALDCPGGWACLGSRPVTMLLGRMAFRIVDAVHVGERCVVAGAFQGRDGRKNRALSALYGEDGRLVAHSQQTWIEVAPKRADHA